MNAAIWSRLTVPEGLYVVADVPLARPEKNASAIWQKKGLLITSVKGSVIISPPQVPVSARWRVDRTVRLIISETSRAIRIANLRFSLIGFSISSSDNSARGVAAGITSFVIADNNSKWPHLERAN